MVPRSVSRFASGAARASRTACLLGLLLAVPASAQVTGYAEISLPAPGAPLEGVVTITGTADHPWFEAYDLAFAYADDPTDTWFPMGDPVDTPVTEGRLGIWDTSGLTDGEYTLRLRVWLQDGTVLIARAPGLRIRNYLAVETPTPVPTALASPTPVPPTPTSTPWPVPAPTPEPRGWFRTRTALTAGGLAAFIGLSLLGGYVVGRRSLHVAWSGARRRVFDWRTSRLRRRPRIRR